MADLTTLEVEVDVNEAYIARVTGGQPAKITLDAYPDTSFRGRVRQVVPTADRQRATVQVKVSDRGPGSPDPSGDGCAGGFSRYHSRRQRGRHERAAQIPGARGGSARAQRPKRRVAGAERPARVARRWRRVR